MVLAVSSTPAAFYLCKASLILPPAAACTACLSASSRELYCKLPCQCECGEAGGAADRQQVIGQSPERGACGRPSHWTGARDRRPRGAAQMRERTTALRVRVRSMLRRDCTVGTLKNQGRCLLFAASNGGAAGE